MYFHPLDITKKESRDSFAQFFKSNYGGIDVLINNAGIAFSASSPEPFSTQAKHTLATNYTATKQFSEIVFPLLRPNARVVNVSSSLGKTAVCVYVLQ